MTTNGEGTTGNSTCKKLAVQWLNDPAHAGLCFVSSSAVKPPPSPSRNRYAQETENLASLIMNLKATFVSFDLNSRRTETNSENHQC